MLSNWKIANVKSERHPAYLKKFGSNLKKIREKMNFSQETLAFDADLSSSQISRIERGIINTSLSQIVSIAKALGIKPRDLFKFD
jgi:transcriptional regulator with XRE-family HTH domain